MLRSHLVIGEITKPQGVRGELKLRPITCDPERFKGLTLATLLCRRLGRLPFRAILGTLARALACAALMALAAYYANGFLSTFIAGYYPRLASFSVLPAIVLAALVYLFAARLLRAPELGFVLEALHRKKSPAKVA